MFQIGKNIMLEYYNLESGSDLVIGRQYADKQNAFYWYTFRNAFSQFKLNDKKLQNHNLRF